LAMTDELATIYRNAGIADIDWAAILDRRALAYRALVRLPEALAADQERERIYVHVLGRDTVKVLSAHVGIAETLLLMHRPKDALTLLGPDFSRAASIVSLRSRANFIFVYAEALWASGQERPRALGLAEQSREIFRQLNEPEQEKVAMWLAQAKEPARKPLS